MFKVLFPVLLGIFVITGFSLAGTVSVDFPLSTDTWQVNSYPYWWHVGDTVYGNRDLGSVHFIDVTIHLPITYNSLNESMGGYVGLDLRLGGTTVTSFTIHQSDGVGTWVDTLTIDFTPTGTMEVRYYETNQVVSGAGSISIGSTGGFLEFTTDNTLIQPASLGRVKAMFD
jgi:hypothetical protein